MKRIYLLAIGIFCCGILSAQCPSSGLNITSQAQIDSFSINYPNCTYIPGGITIQEYFLNSITNLEGLSQITSIGGDIRVMGNRSLTSLKGLDNIDYTDIQGLRITDNPNLSMCDIESICGYLAGNNFADIANNKSGCQNRGMVSLFCRVSNPCLLDGIYFYNQQRVDDFATNYPDCENIMGPVVITGNVNNLNGLSQLKGVWGRNFEIENTALTSLAGLENLTCVKFDMIIGNNDSLSDISALANVDHIGIDSLSIYNNPNLSDCNIESVCDYISNDKPYSVYNNVGDCDTPVRIINNCDAGTSSCLTGGVIFSTQAQIDSFSIQYPNCQYINGDIIIKGNNPTSITNLIGLSSIEATNGNLIIEDNAALSYLNGLEQLSAINGSLEINNNALLNLQALNLTHINGALTIRNNAFIEDLFGLEKIVSQTIGALEIYNNPNLSYCGIEPVCRYLVSSFSNLIIQDNAPGCNDIPEVLNCFSLPVELTTFQAQIQNKSTLLTWQTATETQNEGFEIQRSKDGKDWEKIAWQDGQGDSQTPNDYRYVDENPFSGESYYRLKQVDFDGMFSYSDIVNVNYERSSNISIYPNPTKNTLHIANLNENTIKQIIIYDKMGRQLIVQNDSENTIDVSALSSGIYIIKVKLENGVFGDKFMVE